MGIHDRTPTVKYRPLHSAQVLIRDKLGPRNVLRCGRRFGKTELLESVFSKRAIVGRKVGWFTPDYKLARPTYSRLHKILQPVIDHASKTEAIIQLRGGGLIEFWTLDNEDAGRSRDYDDVVIDEASLKKTGLEDIIDQAIAPTLLDRRGTLTMAGTPKGLDPENFFYKACTDDSIKYDPEVRPRGWREFYAPTKDNPTLNADGVAALEFEYPKLVHLQEYLAEFVDWSGEAFFSIDSFKDDTDIFPPYPAKVEYVFATIDSATKTGKEHDGTGVIYWGYQKTPKPRLFILDWDLIQIEGSMLITWLPQVFVNLERFAKTCGARNGSLGTFIEDKASGMILLQQAIRKFGINKARGIDSKLTSLGKEERAINVSGNVFSRKVVLCENPEAKIINYKGSNANHFRKQVIGYRVGNKEQVDDDLLDCFTYGVAIALGDIEGF